MPTLIICFVAFIFGPASHYIAIHLLESFLNRQASEDLKGVASIIVLLFGWIPGAYAAASLSFFGLRIDFRDAVNISVGPALIGMMTSCAFGPTNPFG